MRWLTARHAQVEMLVAVALVLIVVAGVAFGPVPNTRFASAARDLARFLILGLAVQAALAVALRLGMGARRSVVPVLGGAVGLSLLVEVAEALGGAAFSWADVASAVVAVGAGVGVAASRMAAPRRWVGIAMAVAAAAIVATPFVGVVQSYRVRDAGFPMLLDANRRGDLAWVRPQASPVYIEPWPRSSPRVDSPVFVVPLEGSQQPGIAIDEPYGNWTGRHVLKLELVNPGDRPLDLVLNVDDMRGSGNPGDRFDRNLHLAPHSRQTIGADLRDIVRAIPHRRFALDDMDIVRVYSARPIPGDRLLVTRIWLE